MKSPIRCWRSATRRARSPPPSRPRKSSADLLAANPDSTSLQRDLSVSYNKVGDVQVAQGDLAGALKSYRDSLAIRERLAQSDPGNARWQRDLSVSYEKVGDVQMAQGDLAGALKSYRDGLAISRAAGAIRSRQRRLAARSVGVVQQGRRRAGGAGRPCRRAQVLPRRPRHQRAAGAIRSRQRRLAARSVGVVQEDRRRAGGAGRPCGRAQVIPRQPRHHERLAQSDPGNAGWQRDLWVSYNKVGDVQVAQGDLAGALKSYRDGLAIAERLAQSDPGNAGWQRDLSVSYNRVGDVQWRRATLPAR